jgi:hypothetical protein
MTTHKRSIAFGRGGPQRDVDEGLLVRRYVYLKWTVKRCATTAHIDPARAKKILQEHGVELRQPGTVKKVDETQVIRSYESLGSVHIAATVHGISCDRVRGILDANGIELNEKRKPPGPVRPKVKER